MAIESRYKLNLNVKLDVKELNRIFIPLSYQERIAKFFDIFNKDEILMTSSFGIHSACIIHLINEVSNDQKIHFINTGYIFNETMAYKNELTKIYNLNVIDIKPNKIQHDLTQDESWWIEHSKMCCTINKVAPLEEVISKNKVWISGLMQFQTQWRFNLDIFGYKGDILKFHPLIDMSQKLYEKIRLENKLLDHPLKAAGYGSIGCTHCTEKGEGRTGRWRNTSKTECGLHQNYFYKQ